MTDQASSPAVRIAPHVATIATPSLRLVEGDRATGRPLSILIVLHDFALGGTERIAVRLANAWKRAGAHVQVFAGSLEGPLFSMLDPNIMIVEPESPILRARGSQARLAEAARRHLVRQPADGCFVPGNYHWPVAASLSRMPDGIRPVVIAQISAALRKPQRRGLRQFVYDLRMRHLLGHVDALAALCDSAREEADAIMRCPLASTIALPALDAGASRPIAPHPGNQMILAAGRLVPEKGFDTLIRAFALMIGNHSAHPAARLAIVGEGPDRARLTALAQGLGVAELIDMPGYVPDTRPWLDRSRIFVLASRFEGFPAVMVEALAAGRPVVATACTPATGELLGDLTVGRVVPIDDVGAMAQAMNALLAAPPSDPVRLAACVDRYRIEPVARHYLDLFTRLRAGRARRG